MLNQAMRRLVLEAITHPQSFAELGELLTRLSPQHPDIARPSTTSPYFSPSPIIRDIGLSYNSAMSRFSR